MKARYLLIGIVVVFVASLLTASSYASVDLENCVGMWLFDDDGGDTAEDSSENGNDGALMGNPEWVTGKFGGALEFDGAGSYVNIPSSESLSSDSFTLSLWAKPNELRIQGLADKTPQPNWRLFMNSTSGTVEFDALPGEIGNIRTLATSVGEWSHIAVTYDLDSETAMIYFNGVFVQQAASVDMNIDSPVNIHIASNENNRYNGIIDDVGIFNIALDEDDINEIMTEGLGKVVGVAAVDASGKLAATWASLKVR